MSRASPRRKPSSCWATRRLVRSSVLQRLGAKAPGEYLGKFSAALGDPRPEVRRAAATSLRKVSEPGAEPRAKLRALLRDDDSQVRFAAAVTLQRLHDFEDIPSVGKVLLEGTNQTNHSDSGHCMSALRQYVTDAGPAGAKWVRSADLTPLVTAARTNYSAAEELARLGEPGLRALDGLLASPKPAWRSNAVRGLLQADPANAIPRLVRATRDADVGVGDDSFRVLGWLGTREAVDALVRLLDDAGERARAMEVLARLSNQKLGDEPSVWRAWWQSARPTWSKP